MSTRRNFIRMTHKVDIYSKVSIVNDMGQLHATWNLAQQDVRCLYVRAGSSTSIRIEPTTVEADFYFFYFDHDVDISYKTRFKNVRTYIGDELIAPDWIQVNQIDREISFSGKVQYLQVKVKSVIE